MTTLSKNATLSTLGLPPGDHVLRFHVELDVISFEMEASPRIKSEAKRRPTGFLQKWGGRAVKQVDGTDAWLSHINDKHLK